MWRDEFEAQLRIVLARVAEHEPDNYVVALTWGTRLENGQYPFDMGCMHDPEKVDWAMSEDAVMAFVAGFVQIHKILPVCVMVFHINDIPRNEVVSRIMGSVMEAAALPRPVDIEDVEVWHRWLKYDSVRHQIDL